MEFKDLLESNPIDYTAIGAVQRIMKNSKFNKNVVIFDNEMYFEMKDTKGALNIAKKLGKITGFGEITRSSGGKIGFYDSALEAILGVGSEAYVMLGFEDMTPELIKLSKAKTITDTQYKTNHDIIVGRK